ncbi:hypothetical protein PAMP_017841 [Pampus punctatissimus]
MATAAVGAMQVTYTGIIYAGGVQGGGKNGLVPCLSCCRRGPTMSPFFYKPLVPGAPAHTGVGKEPTIRSCEGFYSALSKGPGATPHQQFDMNHTLSITSPVRTLFSLDNLPFVDFIRRPDTEKHNKGFPSSHLVFRAENLHEDASTHSE